MSVAATTQTRTSRSHPSPKVSGDELFVPASHLLVIDRQISHPAFRLWCVLHRLWFLHEPPTMDVLQNLMGTNSINKATRQGSWQPATRRSIERWLKELEQAGWLLWVRREETTRRYHLRTSARSASDAAMVAGLRTLLNSGKASLAEVQALLTTLGSRDDATAGSHESIPGSQQDAVNEVDAARDATAGSHGSTSTNEDTTAESPDLILGSYCATTESQETTLGSYGTTMESQDTTLPSHAPLTDGVLIVQNTAPYSETLQNQIQKDPTPSSAAIPKGGDGGESTDTERYLLQQGFSTRAAHEFRDLNLSIVQADLERRRNLGQGIGAIVTTWRVVPPHPTVIKTDTLSEMACWPDNFKAQALEIAPVNATEFEIQYLALDLEEGNTTEEALAKLLARRVEVLAGAG
jgi:hypothetical protein